ncbi:hypothetical protein BFP97_03055 [Roseivirga sp. 4D4]|uniref:energy transducer TonB n=1 Tax=Roseivirga sp. 4D4 TaxID=1889784 RepID=UPI000853E29C|nr:energy transducer TonB [Roseivirga sp. 4D4]OEK00545.1 hypothetical protein BFP97_03055 [Roseivirga sp. 4D4]
MKSFLITLTSLIICSTSFAQEKELTPQQIRSIKRFENAKQQFLDRDYNYVVTYYDSIMAEYAYTRLATYKMASESYEQLAIMQPDSSLTYSNLAKDVYNEAEKWYGKMQLADKWDALKIEINEESQSEGESYQKPNFPGGMSAFYEYVRQALQYPQEAKEIGIEGRVNVVFVVNKDGSIDAVNALNHLGGGCKDEAVRVVANAPNFIPARRDGKPAYTQMQLPVLFSLIEDTPTKETKKEKRRRRRKG